MIRIQIQLSEKQHKTLKQIAARENVSISDLVRRAVDQLVQMQAAASVKARRQQAAQVAGRFSSGRSDVSEKHDAYLANAFSEVG